jgi:prepilin-type N-terminal cleavage/methylation domain
MKKQRGFTLIELVIVIAILGILAGIAIPRFLDSRASANGAKLLADLRAIDSAYNVYEARTGEAPTTIDQLVNYGTGNSLLAAVPVPPSSDMLITQNDGTPRRFTALDTSYGITNGRATYTCGEGSKEPVEWYLTYTGSTSGGGSSGVADSLTTSSWASFLAQAASGYGANTDTALYKDSTGIYLLRYNQYVSAQVASANPTLAEYAAANPDNAFKVDTDNILTSANMTTLYGQTVWKEDSLPQAGDVYQDGTNYYVCIRTATNVYNCTSLSNTGDWLKVS